MGNYAETIAPRLIHTHLQVVSTALNYEVVVKAVVVVEVQLSFHVSLLERVVVLKEVVVTVLVQRVVVG